MLAGSEIMIKYSLYKTWIMLIQRISVPSIMGSYPSRCSQCPISAWQRFWRANSGTIGHCLAPPEKMNVLHSWLLKLRIEEINNNCICKAFSWVIKQRFEIVWTYFWPKKKLSQNTKIGIIRVVFLNNLKFQNSHFYFTIHFEKLFFFIVLDA